MIKKNVLTQEQIAEKLDYLRKQRDSIVIGEYRNYLYKLYIYLKKRVVPKPRTAVATHTRGKCSSPLGEMICTNPILDTPTVMTSKHLDISRCKDMARMKRFL